MDRGERLDKFLAAAGVASRRQAKELIRRGRVTVDAGTVTQPGARIDPGQSCVRLDGRTVCPQLRRVYLKLHKPYGYITTTRDPEGRPTVMDLLPGGLPRIYPVGRLDFHSSGLLILTNDGDWAQRVAHPGREIPRTYEVWVWGSPQEHILRDLRRGITLADGPAVFDRADVVRCDGCGAKKRAQLILQLREGRNREVRRVMATVGHPVISLKRVSFGAVQLGQLRPGEWQYLQQEEVEAFC